MSIAGNLFAGLPPEGADEEVTDLVRAPGLRIERIVSHGQASPPGFWYDQDWAEWVVVLRGSAALLFEGEGEPRRLQPGDHVHIPPPRAPSRGLDRTRAADDLACGASSLNEIAD